MKTLLLTCLLMVAAATVQARIVDQDIDYSSGGTQMKGYIVYDDSFRGKRPAVLVVHEWWGHNEYARDRARQLAQLGYVAMAVDMYGDGRQASHPEDAQKFSSEIANNIDLGKQRFMAAMGQLQGHKLVKANKIAAIGYCFGGAVVLQMARSGVDLSGVVSFHGSLGTKNPAQAGTVKARVLVAHGGEDPFVSGETILAFIDEMNKAKANYQMNIYSGAKHSFTNPGASEYGQRFNLPLEYNQQADKDSWRDMQIFLKDVFKD
jgi:dienelactone hydrolase